VPGEFGLYVWQAILDAGRSFGLEPFGVETQRLLRLEKKHLLPGVDTDALSNPIEADLSWTVKLDKPDFVGRKALERAAGRPPRSRLVGFRVEGNVAIEPSSLVVCEGRLGGRVTSCQYSPAAGATIGLAWVPAARSRQGDRFEISVAGSQVTAVVHDDPAYDPPGARLKS
jgi:sarcosine oxidase subunit alpha